MQNITQSEERITSRHLVNQGIWKPSDSLSINAVLQYILMHCTQLIIAFEIFTQDMLWCYIIIQVLIRLVLLQQGLFSNILPPISIMCSKCIVLSFRSITGFHHLPCWFRSFGIALLIESVCTYKKHCFIYGIISIACNIAFYHGNVHCGNCHGWVQKTFNYCVGIERTS